MFFVIIPAHFVLDGQQACLIFFLNLLRYYLKVILQQIYFFVTLHKSSKKGTFLYIRACHLIDNLDREEMMPLCLNHPFLFL